MSSLPFTKEHERVCGEVIFRHSQSFYLSSLLLPGDVRLCAWAIYGFCRTADDAIDLEPQNACKRVESLRTRLDAIYGGTASNTIDDAFARFVHHYKVPRAIPDCLLDGFATDAQGVDFSTAEELIKYSFQVASTVGLMLVYAMQVPSDKVFLKASDLGVAMQLTNIARDMGADFRMSRFYLPAQWRGEAAFDSKNGDFVEASRSSKILARRLMELADRHYASSRPGILLLPGNCQLGITASMYVYSSIGKVICANQFDTISKRARVSVPHKFLLVARALCDILSVSDKVGCPLPSGPNDHILQACLLELGLLTGNSSVLEPEQIPEKGR